MTFKIILIKLMTIILLGNMLFSIGANHIIYKWLGSSIKKEIKYNLMQGNFDKDIELISFDYDLFIQLKWENPNEFVIGEYIYDVLSVDFNIDKVNILCYLDKKESILRQDYFSYFKKFIKTGTNARTVVFAFVDFILAKYILNIFNIDRILKYSIIDFNSTNFSLIEMFYLPISPPPDFLFSK